MPPTMELYLVQSPESVPDKPAREGEDNPRDFLRNMLRAYKDSIPVRDVADLIARIFFEYSNRGRLIGKLVIGSHGYGNFASGYGHFYIGKEIIMPDEESYRKLDSLKVLAPLFAPDADVIIMACQTGNNGTLLQKVSSVLGGVRVHGFTDYVTATNWWIFGATVSDETDDGNREIVCWPSECRDLSYTNPRTRMHPRWTRGYPPGGPTTTASPKFPISGGD